MAIRLNSTAVGRNYTKRQLWLVCAAWWTFQGNFDGGQEQQRHHYDRQSRIVSKTVTHYALGHALIMATLWVGMNLSES